MGTFMIHLQKTPAAVTEYLRTRTGLYDKGILLMRADLGKDLVKKERKRSSGGAFFGGTFFGFIL